MSERVSEFDDTRIEELANAEVEAICQRNPDDIRREARRWGWRVDWRPECPEVGAEESLKPLFRFPMGSAFHIIDWIVVGDMIVTTHDAPERGNFDNRFKITMRDLNNRGVPCTVSMGERPVLGIKGYWVGDRFLKYGTTSQESRILYTRRMANHDYRCLGDLVASRVNPTGAVQVQRPNAFGWEDVAHWWPPFKEGDERKYWAAEWTLHPEGIVYWNRGLRDLFLVRFGKDFPGDKIAELPSGVRKIQCTDKGYYYLIGSDIFFQPWREKSQGPSFRLFKENRSWRRYPDRAARPNRAKGEVPGLPAVWNHEAFPACLILWIAGVLLSSTRVAAIWLAGIVVIAWLVMMTVNGILLMSRRMRRSNDAETEVEARTAMQEEPEIAISLADEPQLLRDYMVNQLEALRLKLVGQVSVMEDNIRAVESDEQNVRALVTQMKLTMKSADSDGKRTLQDSICELEEQLARTEAIKRHAAEGRGIIDGTIRTVMSQYSSRCDVASLVMKGVQYSDALEASSHKLQDGLLLDFSLCRTELVRLVSDLEVAQTGAIGEIAANAEVGDKLSDFDFRLRADALLKQARPRIAIEDGSVQQAEFVEAEFEEDSTATESISANAGK